MATMRIPTGSAVGMDRGENLHLIYVVDGTVDDRDRIPPHHLDPSLHTGHVLQCATGKTATNAGYTTIVFHSDRMTDENLLYEGCTAAVALSPAPL